MVQCQFYYFQVLDNSYSDPTFLFLLALSNCSDLFYHLPFCTRMGCFEILLPMKRCSSLGGFLWHVPLLPAPPCPVLFVPFRMNHWCSAASAALSQAYLIFSSESAHQVFRERLHFFVLAFKNYWSSGASLCSLHSSRFTVTFFSNLFIVWGASGNDSQGEPPAPPPYLSSLYCWELLPHLHHFSYMQKLAARGKDCGRIKYCW